MKQLFELALKLEPPWRVVSSDIDSNADELSLPCGRRSAIA
jgi:hypothetical protein